MLRHKCFSLLVVTACMLGSKAFAADAAVSANGFQEPAAQEPRFEVETESEATTRGNWGVYVQGTGALKGSLDESGFRARIGFGYSGYNYPLTGSELIGAQLPNAPDGLDQIGQIGKIYGYEPGVDILLGYQWVTERWSLMGFLGASILHDSLSYPDPTNKVQGTAWGFKTVWELDAHPTDQTMFYTYASYNTAFDTAHIDAQARLSLLQQFRHRRQSQRGKNLSRTAGRLLQRFSRPDLESGRAFDVGRDRSDASDARQRLCS